MVAATVVDSVVNPNNQAQRYDLWGNGRIDAFGGAPAVTNGPTEWYQRVDQQVAVAFHITDWATGSGYILDIQGGFTAFGAAPNIPRDVDGTFTLGLPYVQERRYADWSWNPSGATSGYVIDVYGEIFEFGGEPDSGRPAIFTTPAVKGFKMRWTPTKAAVILDASGALWLHWDATAPTNPPPYFRGRDVARDLAVTAWAPAAGYVLTGDGAAHSFGGAASSMVAGPYRAGQDVARELNVLNVSNPTSFWQIHSGGQSFDYVASTPPTVVAGGGTSEAQRVTITGNPTGGTFTLTYAGQTTAAIARNATAATVDAALEALSNIGAGDVTVTGGPGPGTPWLVTFGGALANQDLAQMTATSALTGGTSPTVTVATVTGGVATSPPPIVTDSTRPVLTWAYSDPQQDSQAAWELYVFTQAFVTANTMTDPSVHKASALVAQSGINRGTRGITTPIDLDNGAYRFYVRAKDTADQWSPWSNLGWTQNVPVPATPTGLTATANQTTAAVALSVSATTGGTANMIRFEASDNGGTTWSPVVGADAVPLTATTTATDRFIPLGVTRTYRAAAYNTAPRVKSLASSTTTATVTTKGYYLHSTTNAAVGGRLYPEGPIVWTRPVKAGVFDTLGSKFPTVVRDGSGPKARRQSIRIASLDAATQAIISGLALSASTLVLRDPFGDVMFCELVGDWSDSMGKAVPGHPHAVDLPLVEVAPPVTAT